MLDRRADAIVVLMRVGWFAAFSWLSFSRRDQPSLLTLAWKQSGWCP
jgi:hypothetical protein